MEAESKHLMNLSLETNKVPLLKEVELAEFWHMTPRRRQELIVEALQRTHCWHFARNPAYRRTMMARQVSETVPLGELHRLLRPTAQTFKSYIDLLGTPFPQDKPLDFLHWIADQLSIELPCERFSLFRKRYASLENLLRDFERVFSDFGFEILTSSGTSGRATIMVRDQRGIDKTVESFYLAFQRYFGMRAEHRAIFIMPQETRIAMARMAAFSIRRIGLPQERVHFTIPFPAHPDHVRVRSGRTYRQGVHGWLERRLYHPLMNFANERIVMPKAIDLALTHLIHAEAQGEKVLLFGGWIQLHILALKLRAEGRTLHLARGSLLGTGGGFKEQYPYTIEEICQDLHSVIRDDQDVPVPLRDVYGMAEANWAAMQCSHGNYHIPPWVHAVVLNEEDCITEDADSIGLLAFFDPFGGGNLFPAFFKTADRVRLIYGDNRTYPDLRCPCGEEGTYILQKSIQRMDLFEEAGCAAQI